MIYRGKILDSYQVEAIESINKRENVIISAPTGTGKTLVADYAIEFLVNNKERIIYTAPIKALSNQKYREFKELIGEENVGILTGDVTINKNAYFLIMTTEIYRNMLYSEPDFIKDISCVIFDEIHYIGDRDRGTVWEECLLLKPSTTFFVGLSATIPNIKDLANWIEDIKKEKVNIVLRKDRAVPLKHSYFECNNGFIPVEDKKKINKICNLKRKDELENDDTFINLLQNLNQDDFPVLYFNFNRKGCFDKALEYSRQAQLKDSEHIEKINDLILDTLSKYRRDISEIPNYKVYLNCFHRGIGIHHAGLLPILKVVVENLFEKKLLDIVFCTETFAIGINFPVKTVCIDGFRKYDGFEFRNIQFKEYFQIGGRAGRRGIDDNGNVVTLMKLSDLKYGNCPIWEEDKVEEIDSHFKVSYNSTINMIDKNEDFIKDILNKNFFVYLLHQRQKSFFKTKNDFKENLINIRNDTCDYFGKNHCSVHKLERIKLLQDNLSKTRNQDRINELNNEIKIISKTKEISCSSNKKDICRHYYIQHNNMLQKYIKEKENFEENYAYFSDNYFENEFNKKKQILLSLGYIDSKNNYLPRGLTLKNIYIQELLISELMYSDFFEKYPEDVIVSVLSGIESDTIKDSSAYPEIQDSIKNAITEVIELSEKLKEIEISILKNITIKYDTYPCQLMYKIANGEGIKSILEYCDIAEGDIVSIVRKTISILSEIKEGFKEFPSMYDKINNCIKLIDRNEFKVLE